jgi:hypothetical protein
MPDGDVAPPRRGLRDASDRIFSPGITGTRIGARFLDSLRGCRYSDGVLGRACGRRLC